MRGGLLAAVADTWGLTIAPHLFPELVIHVLYSIPERDLDRADAVAGRSLGQFAACGSELHRGRRSGGVTGWRSGPACWKSMR
jgi:hypothetical protein